MSVHSGQKTTTTSTSYRTVKVASPEPTYTTTTSTLGSSGALVGGGATLIAANSTSPVQYSMNGYETVRYLVPVQQAMQQQSYMLMQQPVMQQPVMQQVMSPVYLQSLQNLNIDSDLLYQQQATVSSHRGGGLGQKGVSAGVGSYDRITSHCLLCVYSFLSKQSFAV